MQTARHQHAFTLIELLVVLVIIGIVVGFAVLSVGLTGASDRLEVEARRLVALMQLASDEAVISSSQLGLQIEDDRYRFVRLEDKKWLPLEGDEIFRERQFPDNAQLYLQVEGEKILPGETASPNIYFLSSGEISPFEMELSTEDKRHTFVLKGEIHGRIDYIGEKAS